MFRVINEYMERVSLVSNDEIYNMFSEYIRNYSNFEIKKYSVTVNFNRYVIDIRLKNYSVENAEQFFDDFSRAVSYPYSALHVRFNEGKCVRYRYITCKEDKKGFYCDIVIS